jgi:hypothetical protein
MLTSAALSREKAYIAQQGLSLYPYFGKVPFKCI